MKLSKAQQRVIDLMSEGWELGHSRGYQTSAWMQKDGIGRGGDSEKVNANTFFALRGKGLITVAREGFPTNVYKLCSQESEL